MPLVHAVVLGIVQGVAEFLPISSSGHLRLVPWLLAWKDFEGQEQLERAFDVALHLGTLIGAVTYLRADLARLASGGLSVLRPSRRSESVEGGSAETVFAVAPGPGAPFGDEGRVAWLLVASAVPAALLGALLSSQLDDLAQHEWLIGVFLVVFCVVLLWADRLGGDRSADTFSIRDAIAMGAAQSLALAPGVSRSGATITAARWLGLQRDAAARLSFLMSLPIIGGALMFEGARIAGDGMPPGFGAAFAAGVVASAVTGYGAVWATLRLVRTRSFAPFVAYRVVVGLGVILLAASSFR